MFRLRFTIEYHPRTKNGQPPQSTTGVASASEIQLLNCVPIARRTGSPGNISLILNSSNGKASATLTQKRRFISINSELSSSRVAVRGSSAMPQIGQKPGPSRMTSGCIGHVYSIFSPEGGAVSGEKIEYTRSEEHTSELQSRFGIS